MNIYDAPKVSSADMEFGNYVINKVFSTSSTESTEAMHLTLAEFPRTTDKNVSNWPRRSDRCSSSKYFNKWAVGKDYTFPSSTLKTLPIIPQTWGVVNIDDDDRWWNDDLKNDLLVHDSWAEYKNYSPGDIDYYEYNKNGFYRNYSGDCLPTGADFNIYESDEALFKLAALRDAGTTAMSAYGISGYSVSPLVWGGWATEVEINPSYNKFGPAVEVNTNPDASLAQRTGLSVCAGINGEAREVGTVWVANYLKPVYEFFGHNIKPLWGEQCQDQTNYLSTMYGYTEDAKSKGYTGFNNYQVNNILLSDPLDTSDTDDDVKGIYSLGATYFRTIFNLSEEDLNNIKMAEIGGQGGLFLDYVADDFNVIWVNGIAISSNNENATPQFNLAINSSRLHVGRNLLAVEDIDKIRSYDDDWVNTGAGFGFALALKNKRGYDLTPMTSGSITSAVGGGWDVTFHHSPNKVGADPVNLDTTAQIFCEVRDVVTDTVDSSLSLTGCELTTTSSTTITGYTRSFFAPPSWIGKKICSYITYNPGGKKLDGSPKPNKSSVEDCVILGAPAPLAGDPAVTYFFGGDVFSASDIKFGTTTLYPRSRSQYAMLANGGITNPITANDYDPTIGFKRLVYANTNLPFGGLGVGGSGNNYITNVIGAPEYIGHLNITTLISTPTQSYKPTTGILEIVGAPNVSSQITIRVEGNVKITGNITLDDAELYSLASLPNVTIIASGDITIDSGVTRVEATLIAGGSLKTCSVEPNLQSDCNQPLTINGPTRAKDYYLYRTFTASTDIQASENFLFPPSAIMAPYARGTSSVVPTVQYEIELPPRY